MDLFKVFYYPNSECSPLTLAKGMLVFDEIVFFDHPSLTLPTFGTVGHPSAMRTTADHLREHHGYNIRVVEPEGGPVEGEIQKIIDADMANEEFRKTFFKLLRNDQTFLADAATRARDGDFGRYGSADNYKKELLKIRPDSIPSTVNDLGSFKTNEFPLPPDITIALKIAMDSYQLNYAAFTAADDGLQLFGDSTGMDMLLSAKFQTAKSQEPGTAGIAHKVAFSLLERVIPNEAFFGKKLTDILAFRDKMANDREKFKEHILALTVEIEGVAGKAQQKQIDELIYSHLLPQVRDYQNRLSKSWDTFFKESTKAVLADAHHTAELVATMLPVSLTTALMAGAAEVGTKVMPHLIDYITDKKDLNRANPYSYLMKFK